MVQTLTGKAFTNDVSNNAELYWLPSARLVQALRNVRVTAPQFDGKHSQRSDLATNHHESLLKIFEI